MARFDVYANPDKSERGEIPYLLDVQNNHLLNLQTRVIIPLWSAELLEPRSATLNPAFQVAGRMVAMDTASLGAAPVQALKRPVAHLGDQQFSIQNALDHLFGIY